MVALLLILLLQSPPATLPASQPSLDARRYVEREKLRQSMNSLPTLPPQKLDGVLSLSLSPSDGLLLAQSPIHTTDGVHAIDIVDLPGIAQINIGQSGPAGERWMDFQHIDFTTREAVLTLVQIFAREDYLMLAYDLTGVREDWRVQLIQSPRMADESSEVVRLYVERFDSATEDSLGKVNLKSARFDEMLRNHPAEVLTYVISPVMSRKLHRSILKTSAGEAWQVLGEALPLPQSTVEEVDRLVTQLNADEFAQRESAAEKLRQMGALAAMALQKVDATLLSEEQRHAIEGILASYSGLSDEQIAARKSDRLFLIGVLFGDESALWPVALQLLRREVTSVESEVRSAGDAELRAIIDQSMPATQPAQR